MSVTAHQIQELRGMTSVSLQACKKALEESNGDLQKAVELLRKQGAAKAVHRLGRETGAGSMFSYIHSNGKIGVLVDLGCETDFVAKNDAFQQIGRDIAMHIAAMNPLAVKPEDVDAGLLRQERDIWEAQLKQEKKTEAAWPNILEGKEKKFREQNALLTQPFVKNPEVTVEKLLLETIHKLGENISVRRFTRYE